MSSNKYGAVRLRDSGRPISGTTLTASAGMGIAATQKFYADGVAMSGNTYWQESSSDVFDIVAGGNTFRFDGVNNKFKVGSNLNNTYEGRIVSTITYAGMDLSSFSNNTALTLANYNNTAGDAVGIQFRTHGTANRGAGVFGLRTGDQTSDLLFVTSAVSVPSEKMRVTSAGDFIVGTTDYDGTPAIGRVTIKGSTNDGSTNILVGRDSNEVNVAYINTDGALYLAGNCSAESFTDRTAFYSGDALSELSLVCGKDNLLDHETLPAFARRERVVPIYEQVEKDVEVEGTLLDANEKPVKIIEKQLVLTQVGEEAVQERDLGAMISILTVAVQQLAQRIKTIEDSIM